MYCNRKIIVDGLPEEHDKQEDALHCIRRQNFKKMRLTTDEIRAGDDDSNHCG